MIVETLRSIFNRDLAKLKKEINAYPDDDSLWRVNGNITNPGGNLCLHLVGNLNAYIGAELGKTGYVRHRDLEFSQKNIPRAVLADMIDQTVVVVDKALSTLADSDLEKEYPILVFAEKTSTGYFLVHLSVHLGYHLGQVNYHRRLLAN